jgi:hypothetical protein
MFNDYENVKLKWIKLKRLITSFAENAAHLKP